MSTVSSDRTRSIPQEFQGSPQNPPATDQVQDRLSDVADQAQEKLGAAADQAQDRVRQQVQTRTSQAGEQVNTHANHLRTVADTLREQGEPQAAELADRIAAYGERAGGYLSRADLDSLLGDVERVASDSPGKVALGAMVAGFAASRFLKASGARRSSTRLNPSPARRLPAPTEPPAYTPSPNVHTVAGDDLYAGADPYTEVDPADPMAQAAVVPGENRRGAIPGI